MSQPSSTSAAVSSGAPVGAPTGQQQSTTQQSTGTAQPQSQSTGKADNKALEDALNSTFKDIHSSYDDVFDSLQGSLKKAHSQVSPDLERVGDESKKSVDSALAELRARLEKHRENLARKFSINLAPYQQAMRGAQEGWSRGLSQQDQMEKDNN